MNRFCRAYRPSCYFAFSSLFFNRGNAKDRLEDPPEYIPKNGIERIIKTFSDKNNGEPSESLVSLIQMAGMAFVVGTMVGGMKSGNNAYENFMIANQHEKFITAYEAKRKLQDTVFLNFFRGGFKWGAKAATFTVIYCLCIFGIPAFREKNGIIEFFVGGALAGGICRAYLGLKAALNGIFVGGIMATTVGCIVFLSSKLAHVSMSDVKEMQYGWYKARQEAMLNLHKEIEKARVNDNISYLLEEREVLLKKIDTNGYSENDHVFFVLPTSEESESTATSSENKS